MAEPTHKRRHTQGERVSIMGLRKRAITAVATLAAAGSLGVLGASEVSAAPVAATAVVAPQHGAYQNGCSFSPDSGPWWNFHSSCDRHDLCYHYHYYGGGYSGRLGCDNEFLGNMYASCNNRYSAWNPLRAACYRTANEYYSWVRALGGAFF